MLDIKTLKILDEALDMTLDHLVEENALKKDSPYAQQFIKAQEKVRKEIQQCTLKIIQTKKANKLHK